MEVLTTTPFGRRPVTAGLIERAQAARAESLLAAVNKWEVLRDLTTAKKTFGLNASALTVLNALLSFHRGDTLKDAPALVVFPSNRTLASRCHGMPDSTLRRNVALLVKAGMIARHDSPNGKRYAVRSGSGDIAHAFGFDLRPLLVQAPAIAQAADEVEALQAEIKRARERAGLLKRDCWKFLEYARATGETLSAERLEGALTTVQKHLRRILSLSEIQAICSTLEETLSKFAEVVGFNSDQHIQDHLKTDQSSACDVQNERHIQSSNKDYLDSELEGQGATTSNSTIEHSTSVPIHLVLKACPEIVPYAPNGISKNHELVETAHFLHPMMGISSDVWHHSMRAMGQEAASVALACILQRTGEIRNPGGYLRSLALKAESGGFSIWPMLRALMGKVPEGAS